VADRLALAEGAALLAQDGDLAALEMTGMGGEFEAGEDLRIALTSALMRAVIDGQRIAWNASHKLPQGARLTIGAVATGTYGFVNVGGGVATEETLNARAVHITRQVRQAREADGVTLKSFEGAPM